MFFIVYCCLEVSKYRLEQPPNALSPMSVTEFGMVTLVRLEHSRNALSPMSVTG